MLQTRASRGYNAQASENFFVRQGQSGTPFNPNGFIANAYPTNNPIYQINLSPANTGAVSQFDCDSIVYFRDTDHLQKIALDSVVFTGQDSLPMERLTKLQLFRGIESDSILQLDSILVAFVDTFATTDLGKLELASRQLKLNMAKKDAGALTTTVSNITPQDTIASLWKEVLSMSFSKWADDDSTTVLSNADSTRLWIIGALCPYIDGPAVYAARTILFSLDSAYFALGNQCELPTYDDPIGKWASEEEEKPSSVLDELLVQVYPNPTEGEIIVHFNIDVEDGHNLTISGLDGRLVKQIRLNSSLNTVNLSSLSVGLYFIEITDGFGLSIFNDKIILTD